MNRSIEAPEVVGCSSARLARIKPVMQSYTEQRGFTGLSTLLARRGRVIHFEQVGWQDRESHTPLTADTIFRIYSMTKPIICVALMTLYEEGRFQLLDPVAKFLPAFSKVRVLTGTTPSNTHEVGLVRPITIRDLLTHTAGLTYNFLEDSPVSELYRHARLLSDAERTLEAMIGELARLPHHHATDAQRATLCDGQSPALPHVAHHQKAHGGFYTDPNNFPYYLGHLYVCAVCATISTVVG